MAPIATYRLQLNKHFPFAEAEKILPYLKDLGVSHCYLSPITQAKPGSLHGYDAVNPSRVNPELGGEEAFGAFAHAARSMGLKVILDVVPNHMCITDPANSYWMDVLENGPASPYAKFFDINWDPTKKELLNKVMLPFLGDQYGKVLENGDLVIAFENGSLWVNYFQFKLPIAPHTWDEILPGLLAKTEQMGPEHPDRMELQSIINSVNYLPRETETAPEKVEERRREKEILKKRLAGLVKKNPLISGALQDELKEINGTKGNPRSFDRLETILNKQIYRLCHWRVASDEINYRRFFDVNDLAAIQPENAAVFDEFHQGLFRWIEKGWVQGLRIDHVDGLRDPHKYLSFLREKVKDDPSFYIVVEKILTKDEELTRDWMVQGTTGYDFLNWTNGVFVKSENADPIGHVYGKFTRSQLPLNEVIITAKKLIMLVSMASELRMLSVLLDDISEQHRWSRDFTLESLRFALREVVACFPVYRSYIREENPVVSDADRAAVVTAVQEAKRRNPAVSESMFDFIQSVLLLEHPDGLTYEQKRQRVSFVLKLQQFTGPVMAKGVEDTAFYRHTPLLSLNEVGGNPERFGTSRREFHRLMRNRRNTFPQAMSASTTHDTKRSEGVRARLNVLSEIPTAWGEALRRWHQFNLPHKKMLANGRQIPDKNEEYMLYQTLLGTWKESQDEGTYVQRIQDFFEKAMREAKMNSSWIRPNEPYESGSLEFVRKILDPAQSPEFLDDLHRIRSLIIKAGFMNALSQTLLKLFCPGVPDFYQGSELSDFRLVDPDNRGPVDFHYREKILNSLKGASFAELLSSMEDGRAKLFLIQRGLQFRQRRPELFSDGRYVPLQPEGALKKNIIAFARQSKEAAAVVVAGRFFMDFKNGIDWKDTSVELPGDLANETWRNIFNGEKAAGGKKLFLSDVMGVWPVLCLEKEIPAHRAG